MIKLNLIRFLILKTTYHSQTSDKSYSGHLAPNGGWGSYGPKQLLSDLACIINVIIYANSEKCVACISFGAKNEISIMKVNANVVKKPDKNN